MAKAAKKAEGERQQAAVKIQTKDEANRALKQIGSFQDRINLIEAHEREKIRVAEERMARDTEADREEIAALEEELEKWAKENKAELFKDAKTLELNCGSVGFRWTHWKIKYLNKAATVLAKLEGAGLSSLVRVKKSVNKERALLLENDRLETFGMRKTRNEKFVYEVKPEVK